VKNSNWRSTRNSVYFELPFCVVYEVSQTGSSSANRFKVVANNP
jgi:hypothetical protein